MPFERRIPRVLTTPAAAALALLRAGEFGYARRSMGTWQLFVDESGDFGAAESDLAIVGVLLEGYASPQLAIALRRALNRIFVGAPYPPHAAHHNCPTTLLWASLLDVPGIPTSERFVRRTEGALRIARGSSAQAAAFREVCEAADAARRLGEADAPVSMRTLNLRAARSFYRWLERIAPAEHAALTSESEQQRADFVDFLATTLAGETATKSTALVVAWRGGQMDKKGERTDGSAEYAELYGALIERALAFVVAKESESQLWVHVAERGESQQRLQALQRTAVAHPLVRRARHAPTVTIAKVQRYDGRVHPGIVIADFAANRMLGRVLGVAKRWDDVAAESRAVIGVAPAARCAIVSASGVLPAATSSGSARDAVRCAAEGSAPPTVTGPVWAREQAKAWVDAIRGGAR